MTRQYKRKATVIIGNKESVNVPNAVVIKDLRIVFNVEKDIFGVPNLCRTLIYNLSEKTRNTIDEEYTKIIVNAGYEGRQSLVFAGNIMYVFHQKNNQGDIITNIISGDGHRAYTTSYYNNTLSKTLTNEDVFREIAKSTNLQIDELDGFENKQNSTRGVALSGPTKDLLDKKANEAGVYWSSQDERIITFPKNGYRRGEIIEFSAINGMIGSPAITEIGINLEVLLNAQLKAGTLFKVSSVNPQIKLSNYYFRGIRETVGKGTYRINRLVHNGDTHGESWSTSIEGFILI